MSEDIHLFFGHQNRTKGYIIDVFNNLLIQLEQKSIYPDGKKPRFSNGSILELKIENNNDDSFKLTLSLAITGDYSGNKESEYWVSKSDFTQTFSGEGPLRFKPVPFPKTYITVTADKLMNNFKIDTTLLPDRPIICYFVRHGYSTHNVSGASRFFSASNSVFNTNTSLKDSSLNENSDRTSELLRQSDKGMQIGKKIGTEQALKAGVDFSTILGDRELKSISVSDLVRTHETAEFFLTGLLHQKPNALKEITDIYVLPCFHELQKNGRDEDSKVANNLTRVFTLGQTQGALNRENNTNCRNDYDFLQKDTNMGSYMGRFRISGKQRKSCGSIKVGDRSIELLWRFYKKMYDGKYRDQFEIEYSFKKNPCIGNNFLGLFLNGFYSGNLRGGKTRKRKLNKKYKTHKKNKKSKKNKFIHRNTRKHRY